MFDPHCVWPATFHDSRHRQRSLRPSSIPFQLFTSGEFRSHEWAYLAYLAEQQAANARKEGLRMRLGGAILRWLGNLSRRSVL